MRYEDVYNSSSSESEDETENKSGRENVLEQNDIAIGDWVVVMYDDIWYTGKIFFHQVQLTSYFTKNY